MSPNINTITCLWNESTYFRRYYVHIDIEFELFTFYIWEFDSDILSKTNRPFVVHSSLCCFGALPVLCRYFAMPGKPKDQYERENEIANQDRPTLTDRLNKFLLCAYLNRLNEEDRRVDEEDDNVTVDSEETSFSD